MDSGAGIVDAGDQQVVDPADRVAVVVAGPPAGAVGDAEMVELGRGGPEARQHPVGEAEWWRLDPAHRVGGEQTQLTQAADLTLPQ